MIQTIQTGKRSGFTLLELLLVIGIIAALVGLAMPYYQDYVGQSKNSIMLANLHTLKKALMEYRSDKGDFPPTLDTLVPKYLMDLPVDPETSALIGWGYSKSAPYCSFDIKYAPYFSELGTVAPDIGKPIMRLRP